MLDKGENSFSYIYNKIFMNKRNEKEIKQEEMFYKVTKKDDRWIGFRICPECKEEIKHSANEKYYLLRNIRKFANVHCASCNKKGENNHFFGKKHSEKSKQQNSKNRTGKACAEKNAMAKPEYRKKVSEELKFKYKSGELDFLKKIQSETAKKNQSLGLLKYAPISAPEKEIKTLLESMGFKVQSQYPIESLHYDLFVKEKNLLIEYNGDYWHCNPDKYSSDYINKKKNMSAEQLWKQDENKKNLAISNNFNFIVIWESDYKKNKEKEINKILNL